MKSRLLTSNQHCAPLTYLRSPEKLACLFGHSQCVLIAAPGGSGRRTLVYQWLGSRAANAVWFYVAKPPSIPVAVARQGLPPANLDGAGPGVFPEGGLGERLGAGDAARAPSEHLDVA